MSKEKKYEELIIQGVVYKTTLTRKFRERINWEAPNKNMLYSIIPGTIIDIFVKPGQKVKEGETLLLLEAMKMQNQIRMPFDGKIVKVHVKIDELVPNRYLMIEIKPIKL